MENERGEAPLKLSGSYWSEKLGDVIPQSLTIPDGRKFRWNETWGCFTDGESDLYMEVEPDQISSLTPWEVTPI
ncbi:hypothetical protein FDJ44_gp57 [Microbacterium phage Pikmin]|uniref:Uncharacterized protein n=3 Tax=Pikminvirus pikmin TaxID=2560596 RepID=A0A2P1CKH9_9CAUD|nr:hypothetical protein FDJ44_gp57 [Microbacterium phage Pikmin]AVJ51048.1 hypothetical protein PBI_PAJAZA_57 [Microbacterium phage Pajaza]AVJ51195.1 hypothetical protein PBI_PIKMIN_57 [Microbacterium phage Pikmin]AVJ51753.1 hypothetical protein PBI_CASEY_57 [Microbacterium phage Casey]